MTADTPVLISWEFRLRTVVSCQALLRILHEAGSRYGGDMEAFVIYLAVTCATVEGALRDAQLAANPPPPGRIPGRHYRPISRRAIAASTGLPRETVRRKIAAFLDSGELLAVGSGVRVPPGVLEDARNFEFAELLVAEFRRTGTMLDRLFP